MVPRTIGRGPPVPWPGWHCCLGCSPVHAWTVTVPYWAGILFGYLWYDFTHWSTHFRKPLTDWGKRMRSHHMAHHFAVPDKNFGISHMWLDRMLKTLRVRETKES